LSVVWPGALPAGTRYWKFGPTPDSAMPHWYELPATISGNTATFSITDGGLGDDDLAPNGTIVDQGGPGTGGSATAPEPVPTLSEWAMMVLVAMIAFAGMGAMRRRAR